MWQEHYVGGDELTPTPDDEVNYRLIVTHIEMALNEIASGVYNDTIEDAVDYIWNIIGNGHYDLL